MNIVTKYGATVLDRSDDGSYPVSEATHVVANTIDFPDYTEAVAMMVPVIRADWIMASLTKHRILSNNLRQYTPDPRLIFSSVVVTCADIPNTDKETIIGAVMALGGMEQKDLTKQVTHICALSMDHPKVVRALESKSKAKIVLPHWYSDTLRAPGLGWLSH